MIQYAENRKRWEESRKIAMTTVIQNSGIQLGWNRMRKRRNPALDRNETVRKSGAARVRTHRSVRKSAAIMNAANPRHRRMPAVTVKRHRADDRTRDVLLPARKRISGMQNSRSRWKNAFMLWSRSGSAQSVRKTGWSAATSGNWNASPGRQSAPDGRRSAVRRIHRVTQMTVRPCWM